MGEIIGAYIMPHPPIIIPEIGKGEEAKVQATIDSCSNIAEEIANLKPDTIIYITPHGPVFRDAVAIAYMPEIAGSLENFNAPEIKFRHKINTELLDILDEECDKENLSVIFLSEKSSREYKIIMELDHGTMVPMYYINKRYSKYSIVHITYGMLSSINLYRLGMAIDCAVKKAEGRVVVVASGDLSHRLSSEGPYSYNPNGEIFDRELIDKIKQRDINGIFKMNKMVINEAGECGLRSFYMLFGCLNEYDFIPQVLSYEGPFGVGYGVVRFNINGIKKGIFKDIVKDIEAERSEKIKGQDIYVRLARESLEYYLKTGEYMKIPKYAAELTGEKHGVFVSLKKHGELRGCIGTISPIYDNAAVEIIKNAVEAGLNDPRFDPVDDYELDDIDYSVDVLMPGEKADINDLDPKKYGVIVTSGFKKGLLLPDLEGVDTVEDQVAIALKKAGIYKEEKYTIERFEVIRHR